MLHTDYQIQLQSPLGMKKGTASVQLQDGQIILELLGDKNTFCGNISLEYTFQMTGTLKTAVRELPGTLQGTISQQGLQAVFHTEQGDFPIIGCPAEDFTQA